MPRPTLRRVNLNRVQTRRLRLSCCILSLLSLFAAILSSFYHLAWLHSPQLDITRGYTLTDSEKSVRGPVPPPLLLSAVANELINAGQHAALSGSLLPGAKGKQPGLIVKYASCGGLFNQHYCHIAGIAAAIAIGAEAVIMPPALARNGFTQEAAAAVWSPAAASSVWDMERLAAYLDTKGMDLIQVPTWLPSWLPDGIARFNPFGLSRLQVVRFPYLANELFTMRMFVDTALERISLYIGHLTRGPNPSTHARLKWRQRGGQLIADLRPQIPHWAVMVEEAASRSQPNSLMVTDPRLASTDWQDGAQIWQIMGKFLVNQTFCADWGMPAQRPPDDVIPFDDVEEPRLRDGYELPVDAGGNVTAFSVQETPERLMLVLPCMLFGLRSLDSPLMTEIARNLHFAPHLVDIADKIITGMKKKTGSSSFNGLHLRLEADAAAWIRLVGGEEFFWETHFEAMTNATFTTEQPLYVASGIFDDVISDSNQRWVEKLSEQHASHVFHKSDFIGARVLGKLHSEQKAAVDFLVLIKSQGFTGFATSTFSIFVDQYRKLLGMETSRTVFVHIAQMHQFAEDMMEQGATFTTGYS